jgi:hypothetical protein
MKNQKCPLVEFTFDHQSKLIFEKYRGTLTLHEFFDAIKQKCKHPEFHDEYSTITDLSESSLEFREFELLRAIRLLQHNAMLDLSKSKNAVITQTMKQFEMALLYKVFTSHHSLASFRIFSSKEASLDWIR